MMAEEKLPSLAEAFVSLALPKNLKIEEHTPDFEGGTVLYELDKASIPILQKCYRAFFPERSWHVEQAFSAVLDRTIDILGALVAAEKEGHQIFFEQLSSTKKRDIYLRDIRLKHLFIDHYIDHIAHDDQDHSMQEILPVHLHDVQSVDRLYQLMMHLDRAGILPAALPLEIQLHNLFLVINDIIEINSISKRGPYKVKGTDRPTIINTDSGRSVGDLLKPSMSLLEPNTYMLRDKILLEALPATKTRENSLLPSPLLAQRRA